MITNDTNFAYNLRREALRKFVEAGYNVTLAGQILNFQKELEGLGCELADIKTARQGTSIAQDLLLF